MNEKYDFSIENLQTKNVLFASSDWRMIMHYWHCIPKRKNTDLIIVDNTTGEILKTKERRNKNI